MFIGFTLNTILLNVRFLFQNLLPIPLTLILFLFDFIQRCTFVSTLLRIPKTLFLFDFNVQVGRTSL